MNFDHYTDLSVRTAADLVNSRGSITGREYLGTVEELRRFLRDHKIQVSRSITMEDVHEVHRVRDDLRAVFEARSEKERARRLNAMLAETGALPQITNHDGDWHFHYVPVDAPVARRLAACVAMGLSVVVCEFGHDRLGICAADDCRAVYVDTSRNRSRRYCNETCSSRMNVAAYRARRKAGAPA